MIEQYIMYAQKGSFWKLSYAAMHGPPWGPSTLPPDVCAVEQITAEAQHPVLGGSVQLKLVHLHHAALQLSVRPVTAAPSLTDSLELQESCRAHLARSCTGILDTWQSC